MFVFTFAFSLLCIFWSLGEGIGLYYLLIEANTATIPQKTIENANSHILIIGDEPINQQILQRMLLKDGFQDIMFTHDSF